MPSKPEDSRLADTRPKPFAFVLMPLGDEFNDTYQLGVRAACEAAGAFCERVDEQIFEGSILQRIYNQIDKADMIIADMSGKNPNVFYETGYAHALGKRVILLTQTAADIPFDLKHYSHIVYGESIVQLKEELERHVRWFMENPKQTTTPTSEHLQFYIRGKRLTDGAVVNVLEEEPDPRRTILSLAVDIFNYGNHVHQGHSVELGLVVPPTLARDEFHSSIQLPSDRFLVDLGSVERIFPKSWKSIPLKIHLHYNEFIALAGSKERFALRVITELESRDIKFWLDFKIKNGG